MPKSSIREMTFASLVTAISEVDQSLRQRMAKAVNVTLTVRNWLIGYYILEFEQKGKDRAKYGAELIEKLSNELRARGATGVTRP